MRTTIHDLRFQRTVTLADAYRILEAFVVQYNERGASSTASLMSDIGIVKDGGSADPAQLDDFLRVCTQVFGNTANHHAQPGTDKASASGNSSS